MVKRLLLVFLLIVFIPATCLADNGTACGAAVAADNATVSAAPAGSTDNATAAGPATLILVYSKTGTSKIVADEVHQLIPGSELVEVKSNVGIMKAMMWHRLFGLGAKIEPVNVDLSQYERVILCSPIWMQAISSPASQGRVLPS